MVANELAPWEMQPTVYAVLVGRLDLCQDYFNSKGSEDGQPKYDYDIGSKASNTTGYSMAKHVGPTRIPEKTVSISDFTLSYPRHIEHANAEADIVEDAFAYFLRSLMRACSGGRPN